MKIRVKPTDLQNKPLLLCAGSTAEAVMQSIAIIMATQQHSVPHYRDFGLPMRFTHMPMNVAPSVMTMEMAEALRKYEPLATILGIYYEEDEDDPVNIIPVVEVNIDEEP